MGLCNPIRYNVLMGQENYLLLDRTLLCRI